MNILEAAVLGVVEGITEYLPVSSTGHLILTGWLLGLDGTEAQREAMKRFEVIVQGGAILAVLGLYRGRLMQIARGALSVVFSKFRDPSSSAGLKLGINLFVSFIPAAVLGLLARGWIKSHLFSPVPVLLALFLGGVLMIAITPWHRRRQQREKSMTSTMAADGAELSAPRLLDHAASDASALNISMKAALLIGLLQCLALFPGTSRSMVTIVGGMLVGMSARRSAEYSFLLALPVLGGACLIEGKDAFEQGNHFMTAIGGAPSLLVGLVVATLSAVLAVKWLVSWLSRSSLAVFGVWRIVLAGALWLGISLGWLTIST